MVRKLLGDYGMVLVLLALCVLFSVLTLKEQTPDREKSIDQLVEQVTQACEVNDVVLAVGAANKESGVIAEGVGVALTEAGLKRVLVVAGTPRDLRVALDELAASGQSVSAIAASGDVLKWRVLDLIPETHPDSAGYKLLTPVTERFPDFLKWSNLLAIVDRIVVIAVIAIGMTMVIITAGIDLSVGSLIALSAVVSTLIMKQLGGLHAPWWAVLVGFLGGIAACGLIGAVEGVVVAQFGVPAFITTLSFMLMVRGLAFDATGGFSIYQVPEALTWLGRGRTLGVPNTVLLLFLLYVAAHIFMSHTRLGRYIYAVGGNREAARLSGVPVKRVTVFVYVVCAMAAGLGGCIQASQLKTGTPNMGGMFELYVIAAVVVGGTSLSGGSGRVFGTLIGAFIISVIQNGMNLLGMGSYRQMEVLGGIILVAAILDKARNWKWWRSNRRKVA